MATEILTETVARSVQTNADEAWPLPLENGDRLTRAEFERRYEAMPGLKKAELIEGVVFMPSPVRFKSHGKPHSQINGWLFNYSVATPGTEVADNSTLRLDPDNEPQLKNIHANSEVYKFYFKHIDSENVFLGTKWDADTSWQQALMNQIKGFKLELRIN